jgi:hypothetical protein
MPWHLLTKLAVPLLIMFGFTAKADIPSVYQFTGNYLLDYCTRLPPKPGVTPNPVEAWYEAYCFGVVDGTMGTLISTGSICLPSGVTLSQGIRIVITFMERHPELLNNDMRWIADEAFHKAFPCRVPRGR